MSLRMVLSRLAEPTIHLPLRNLCNRVNICHVDIWAALLLCSEVSIILLHYFGFPICKICSYRVEVYKA